MGTSIKLILFLAVLVLYFFNLGTNQVWQPNEAFYADGAKNMLKTGDFLTPVFNGEIRLNKPPVTYWIVAMGFFLFGLNEWALRIFHALMGIGTALMVYHMAKISFGERSSVVSFLAMSLSFLFVANSRYASPEVPLTFFITLSLYLWFLSYKKHITWAFCGSVLASSLAVLTKGPVGFLLPASVIFLYLILTDRRELFKLKYYLGTFAVVLLSGWWYLYQFRENKEIFLEVFLKENIKRVYAMEGDPFYFYLLDINFSFLPYSFLVFPATLWALKSKRKELLFFAIWFLWPLFVFSLVKMKLPLYIMPSYPAMAVLVGVFLSSVENKALKVTSWILSVLLLTAVPILAFLFVLEVLLLILILILGSIFVKYVHWSLKPSVGALALYFYFAGALLPAVEGFRPYKDIGEAIKKADPQGKLRTYEVGAFHYNLPFYADRPIKVIKDLPNLKDPALVLTKESPADCETIGSWRIYKGSESKFFKFLRDIKRNRNFHTFTLCVLNP